jgi:cytochrome c-type biogenesis protein CcmF
MTINNGDIAVGLTLAVIGNSDGKETIVEPVYLIKNRSQFAFAKKMDEFGLKFKFTQIIPEQNKFELVMLKKPGKQKDYVIMKAIVFPYINFLWAGTIIMVIGFLFSITRRVKELKTEKAQAKGSKAQSTKLEV